MRIGSQGPRAGGSAGTTTRVGVTVGVRVRNVRGVGVDDSPISSVPCVAAVPVSLPPIGAG